MKRSYGPRFRVLHWCTDQILSDALAKMELTASQGRIIGYLTHRNQFPCAKDIEAYFHLSHPSVSGTLSRMEKKGFIAFVPDEEDHRRKRIRILPKGKECQTRIEQTINELEQRVVADFSPEEREQFSALLDRAIRNMGIQPCQVSCKEETEE